MHTALYKIFDISETPINERLLKDTIKSKLKAGWQMVEKKKREYYTDKERLSLFSSIENENAYKQKCLQSLTMYMANVDNVASLVPFMLEDWIECRIGGFFIGSRVDRIDSIDAENIRVVDYKTGKLPFRDTLDKIAKEDYQMPFNAIIMSHRFRSIKTVKCELHYIAFGTIFDADWTIPQVKEMEDKLLLVLNEIKSAKTFEPKKNPLCDWCDFKYMCPEFINKK